MQLIKRKQSEQWYINFPSAIVQAMDFERGETVEWIIENKGLLALKRQNTPPSVLEKNFRNNRRIRGAICTNATGIQPGPGISTRSKNDHKCNRGTGQAHHFRYALLWSGTILRLVSGYRLFSGERIDMDALFAPARKSVLKRLAEDSPLTVVMDDTIVRKRGRKVHGTGWKRDPLGPHFYDNFVWAQRFLQMSAALPDTDCPGRARGIPIDLVHAPSPTKPRKKDSEDLWRQYRLQQAQCRVTQVAKKNLLRLRGEVSERKIICSVDGGFTNQTFFRDIPDNTALIGRIRKDARLFAPPEENGQAYCGRKPYYGEVLPTPEQIRQEESVPWQKVNAYASGKQHDFEVKHILAVRWKGTGDRTAQVVIIRPLSYP